jgi:hypothetical protein
MEGKGKVYIFEGHQGLVAGHFLLRREILEEVKKNLYIFGGGGEFGKNPIEKEKVT